MVVWWGARVECVSALARLERERTVTPEGANRALSRLQEFSKIWDEVQPTDRLRSRAERLLRAHQLRTADSLQLSAMLELAGDAPLATETVCFDDRLSAAARREGLQVATR
jgi:predicted nucleic acid-binding protein